MVNGYFIPRSGGMHQGVSSLYFEKLDDTNVLFSPYVIEIPAQGSHC